LFFLNGYFSFGTSSQLPGKIGMPEIYLCYFEESNPYGEIQSKKTV